MTTPLFTAVPGIRRDLAALHPDAVSDDDRPVPFVAPPPRGHARAAVLVAALAAVAATGALLGFRPPA